MLFNYNMMCHPKNGIGKSKKLAELHLHYSINDFIHGVSVAEQQIKIYARNIDFNLFYINFQERQVQLNEILLHGQSW